MCRAYINEIQNMIYTSKRKINNCWLCPENIGVGAEFQNWHHVKLIEL